jgi:hypothetical protein
MAATYPGGGFCALGGAWRGARLTPLRIWPRADSAKAAGAFSWVGSAFGTNPECKPPRRTRQGHCGSLDTTVAACTIMRHDQRGHDRYR